MALREHLGAHQQIDFTIVNRGDQCLRSTPTGRDIAIEPGDTLPRKLGSELFLEPLRAASEAGKCKVAALRTGTWHGRGAPTVVTDQLVPGHARAAGRGPVQHSPGRAFGATAQPTAGVAPQHRRVATAIDEHQCLLASGKRLGNGRLSLRSERRLTPQAPYIKEMQLRQGTAADPGRHL